MELLAAAAALIDGDAKGDGAWDEARWRALRRAAMDGTCEQLCSPRLNPKAMSQ